MSRVFCLLALGLFVVSVARAGDDDEVANHTQLIRALEDYAAPGAGPKDVSGSVAALVSAQTASAAERLIAATRRAATLLGALDADQRRLEQKTLSKTLGVDPPKHIQPAAHREYRRRLPELLRKKLAIQAKQRERLAAMHAALLEGVGRLRGPGVAELLAEVLEKTRDRDVYRSALNALVRTRSLEIVRPLLDRLKRLCRRTEDEVDVEQQRRVSAQLTAVTGGTPGETYKDWKRWWARNRRKLKKERSK